MVISQNLPLHCGKFESTIAYLFPKFSLIVLIMPYPIPISIRHEVLAIAHEGMRQSAITGRVVLTHSTVNCIFQRHAATGTLTPGKSTRVPRKITPHQHCALLRVVWQDCFINARGPWWRGWAVCMEWGLAGKPSTTNSFPVVAVFIDLQGSPCWLPTTAVSTWSVHRGGRTRQCYIGHMSFSRTSQDSNFSQ